MWELEPPSTPIDVSLANRLVQAAGVDHAVWHVHKFSGHKLTSVYELVGPRDASPLVLKLYPTDKPWMMTQEVYVLSLIRGVSDTPVPDIVAFSDDRSIIPHNYVVMTKLPGEVVGGIKGLLPGDYRSIYKLMGRLLRQIHEVTFSSFGFFGPEGMVESHSNNGAWMERRFDLVTDAARNFGLQPYKKEIHRFMRSRQSAIEHASPVLCHSDIHEGNVFAERSEGTWQLTGVIDASGATAGDPLFDVARTLYLSAGGDHEKRVALLAGYGPTRRNMAAALELYELYHAMELRNWCADHYPGSSGFWNIECDIQSLLSESRYES
jgi:aminoglycoside phosphotransferase (APT) family kinase protein